jgi:predicted nucleotidyltransferase
MINEKDQILTFLRQHKADFQRQFGIEKIGLFGSAVRGELTGNSDIDKLVQKITNSKRPAEPDESKT